MINARICAAGLLLLSTGIAAAAPARVETDLNVRAGEGAGFPVIAVMPAGTVIDARGCGDGWCYVAEYGGFASAAYLNVAGAVYASPAPAYVSPPAAVVVPGPVYRSYHDPLGPRVIRRGIREFRRELRHDRRQDRREVRQELRQDRREARQERRERRQDRRRD